MTTGPGPGLRRLVERLAFVGVAADDSDEVRVQKVTLTLAAVTVTVLSVAWVGTYLALGLPVSAAIPFAYQVVSIATLAVFARTKDYRFFRFSQLVLIIALPFLLQWSLGGYVASSAVSLWALEGALGAMFFYRAREAIPWFVAFVGLTVVSGLAEPQLSQHAAAIPTPIADAFFVLNIVGVSFTAYLLLQYAVRARDAALAQSEGLLLNVLPKAIADRLKRDRGVIAQSHADVTVLFADLVDFTPFTQRTAPERVVSVLNEIFSAFDGLAERHGLEKIKTIGDAYMVAGGLPQPRPDHAEAVADMALDMRAEFGRLCTSLGLGLQLRIGMASGPVIAGVIGRHKFIYDLWGDTVNLASRMESSGLPGEIQVNEATFERLRGTFAFKAARRDRCQGKGPAAGVSPRREARPAPGDGMTPSRGEGTAEARGRLFARLEALGVVVRVEAYPEAPTVEEGKRQRGPMAGTFTKNLLLTDKKGRLFLVSVHEDRVLDLRTLHSRIGASGRLSFAPAERMVEVLGVAPGALTPLAIVNDGAGLVTVVLDATLMTPEQINFHPLVASESIGLAPADFFALVRSFGHEPVLVDLDEPLQ